MLKGLVITERDSALLLDCYQHGFLAVSQIRQRHFGQAGKSAAHNRLSTLTKARLLRAFQVGTIVYHGHPKRIGVVYQITRNGIGFLKEHYPSESFRDEPVRLSTSSLAHDLLLTETVTALRRKYPASHIQIGRVGGALSKGKRIPDAMIAGPLGKVEVAVELELTVKSDKRYREIVLQYRLAPEYPKVLYLVPGKTVIEKLRRQITGLKEVAGLPAQPTGKFYFTLINELLRNPVGALITNGKDELILNIKKEGVV